MTSGEKNQGPELLEAKITEIHTQVGEIQSMQAISRARNPVQKLGEQVIDGVQYDILDKSPYYDLPSVQGDELVGHAPTAEAFFGIKPGSQHTIDMAFAPGFASGDGEYEPGTSYISITDRSKPNRNETFQYSITEGDPSSDLGPSADKSKQIDSRNQTDTRTEAEKETDRLLSSLGAMGSTVELPDDLKEFVNKSPDADERVKLPEDLDMTPEVAAEMVKSERDFTLADAEALKEIVDFAHRKMLEEAVNPSE